MNKAELQELAARAANALRLPVTVRAVLIVVEPESGNVGWVAQVDTRETMLILQNVLHDNAN